MDITEIGSFIHEIDQQYAPAISTPLDSLCGEYKKLKDDIERIASYVAGESGAIHYFMDGAQVAGTRCHSSPGEFPEKLKFTVEGEVRTGNAEAYLAIPVICEVAFPRVGKRFYASGELLSVEQSGPPTEYEPEEEQMDFSYMSELDD